MKIIQKIKKLIFALLAMITLTLCSCDESDNTYCPAAITIQNHTVYGATSVFTKGEYSSAESMQNTKKKLYFTLASEESGTAVCIYDSKNLQVREWLYANKPLKADRGALQNNWARDRIDNDGSLSCFYNAKHCPFMNY